MRHLPTSDEDKYTNGYTNKVIRLLSFALSFLNTFCSNCQPRLQRWISPLCLRLSLAGHTMVADLILATSRRNGLNITAMVVEI